MDREDKARNEHPFGSLNGEYYCRRLSDEEVKNLMKAFAEEKEKEAKEKQSAQETTDAEQP